MLSAPLRCLAIGSEHAIDQLVAERSTSNALSRGAVIGVGGAGLSASLAPNRSMRSVRTACESPAGCGYAVVVSVA
jgi:hypothetical protein